MPISTRHHCLYRPSRLAVLLLIGFALPTWAQPIEDRAAALHDADRTPSEAVEALMNDGFSAARSTRAVVDEWSDCEATYEAVSQALTTQPDALTTVVSAVTRASGCGCSAEALWARSRLEARLRPDLHHFLVGMTDDCGCSAAAVGAASELLPERTDEAMTTAIVTLQPTGRVVDSIGQIGNTDWATGLEPGRTYHRNIDACEGDTDPEDEFQPVEWGPDQAEPECEADEAMLEQVSFGEGDAILAVVNRTDDDIDLAAQRLAIDVYFREHEERSYRLPLSGTLEPGERLLLTTTQAGGGVPTGLAMSLGDAVTLVQQTEDENCDCAQPVGGATAQSAREDQRLATRLADSDLPLACRGDLVRFIEILGDQPTFFAQDPRIFPPDELDPDRVDPLASPN